MHVRSLAKQQLTRSRYYAHLEGQAMGITANRIGLPNNAGRPYVDH